MLRGAGGGRPVVGIGGSGGVGSVVAGLAWDASSGTVKDNLGGSGSNDEGEWPLALGGVLSSARYGADAGVKEGAANNVMQRSRAWCGTPRAQFPEHPPGLNFGANHGFGTLKNPPSPFFPHTTLIIGVVFLGGSKS